MKKIILFTLFLTAFLLGTAHAVPMDRFGNILPNTPGYTWVDAPYWTFTDTTTNNDGESTFILQFEEARYESDFGIYTVDDPSKPSQILKEFTIFEASDEPFGLKPVYFSNTGSDWQVRLANTDYQDFDNVFGFFFKVYIDGVYSHTYYSDPAFNTKKEDIQHVAMESDGVSVVKIRLDDQTCNPDWDWNDMSVIGTDLAPVPEPSTMFLFGTGLIGLAFMGRKTLKVKKRLE